MCPLRIEKVNHSKQSETPPNHCGQIGKEKKMEETHFSTLKPESPDTIRSERLEMVPYQYAGRRDVEINVRYPEFTSVCPMTGLPDFGCITIRYTPLDRIVELKSLKYYFIQYRNVGIFDEHLVNRILDDLAAALQPKWIEVAGDFTSRGGMTSRVTAVYPELEQKRPNGISGCNFR
jgi:7-cyano-7-deazaguanine reductase